MKIGYARVSTVGQDLEGQIETLKEHGCEKIYQEKKTGASRNGRTQLDIMLEHARAGDTIMVTKIDRLARSIIDLNNIVDDLTSKDISVVFIDDDLSFSADDTTPMNKLMFNMLGSFAQFERDLIVRRTSEGRKRAIEQGKHMGRPAQPKQQRERAVALFLDRENNGLSVKDITDMTGVPRASIYREVDKYKASENL